MEAKRKEYYEGILQLRNPTKEVINAVKELLEKKNDVFIAKEEKVANGIDLYISSQKYLQVIGKKLQSLFGGEFKISRRIFTTHKLTSKSVYRVTILFRLPKFKIGDIIKARGRNIKVLSLGKKISGIDIETGKRITFDYKFA